MCMCCCCCCWAAALGSSTRSSKRVRKRAENERGEKSALLHERPNVNHCFTCSISTDPNMEGLCACRAIACALRASKLQLAHIYLLPLPSTVIWRSLVLVLVLACSSMKARATRAAPSLCVREPPAPTWPARQPRRGKAPASANPHNGGLQRRPTLKPALLSVGRHTTTNRCTFARTLSVKAGSHNCAYPVPWDFFPAGQVMIMRPLTIWRLNKPTDRHYFVAIKRAKPI